MPSRRLLAELRGATLESRLEEMGVLRSFSRPRMGVCICGLVQPPQHHSEIKFMTLHQRHSGAAKVICQQRTDGYEAARCANPTRWSGAISCWSQPAEVWINKPTEEPDPLLALALNKAA